MAKLTQKERRIRKQNKGLSTQEPDRNSDDAAPTQAVEQCAICMEGINTSNR